MPLPATSPAAMASAFSVLNGREGVVGDVEDVAPAADLGGQVEDRHDDHEVDQGVLDEGDQGGCPEAAGVGVGRQDHEGDEQRQVLDDPVVAVLPHAHHVEDDLDADQLQGDVGHRREDAGDGDGQRERLAVVAALHEVGRRDVAVPVGDRPELREEQEDQRVDHDRVRHREEADHAAGVQRRRDRDEGVRRVEVAADQEPGDEGAEAPAAEAPLVEVVHPLGAAPAGGREAEDGDDEEQEDEDADRDGVHRGSSGSCWSRAWPRASRSLRSAIRDSANAMTVSTVAKGISAIWNQ